MHAEHTRPRSVPALLTQKLVREHFLPVGERTFWRMISAGRFPAPDIASGGKLRFWKRETVEGWIEAQANGGAQ
jgi:predicted DNA-binding transcriptional regulator AlpA